MSSYSNGNSKTYIPSIVVLFYRDIERSQMTSVNAPSFIIVIEYISIKSYKFLIIELYIYIYIHISRLWSVQFFKYHRLYISIQTIHIMDKHPHSTYNINLFRPI